MENRNPLTQHGAKRIKERVSGHVKSLKKRERLAALAFERGKPVSTTTSIRDGRLTSTLVIYYQSYHWIYSEDRRLITVYPA